MCGIAGFIDFKKTSTEEVLKKMTRTMDHRGPDGEGYFFKQQPQYTIGFGHKRLSIIDLSVGGTQPMHYNEYSILLNGEVYNYAEIKKQLQELGHQFVSTSDTEVVLHAYIQWGENCLQYFVGMFAIVIYNANTHQIFCARDRAGVKPFYYYWHEGLFLFTSELKAFHQHPQFIKKINTAAVASFLQYGYVPAPFCIFEHTHKLQQGYVMQIDLIKQKIESKQYWSIEQQYNKPKIEIDFVEAKQETEKILAKAFAYRMVADVPVGVFLSGGYDSTSVATLLQANSTQKLKTFTIGVGDEKLNEAPYAKEIAQKLGTDHTEYYCTEQDALELIEHLPFYYDEPFGDSSAIPTMLVSKLARKNVTVALSADAGDEIFAGYNRYDYVNRYINKIQKVPSPIRSLGAIGMDILPLHLLSKDPLIAYRYRKIREIIKNPDVQNLMQVLTSEYYNDEVKKVLVHNYTPLQTLHSNTHINASNDDITKMMAIDYQTYLPDDILQKVDRATMSVSLEGREPFLDQHVIEWAAQLPIHYKYNNGTKKYILKEIVHDYIPKEMMDRPKMGFAIPIAKWLREDLKPIVDIYLSKEQVEKYNCLQYKEVEKMLKYFNAGKIEYSAKIWYILMFQMWCAKWM